MSRSRAALIAVLLASCNPASGETTTNVDLTPEQQECVDIYECEVACGPEWPAGEWPPEDSSAWEGCENRCTGYPGPGTPSDDPWFEWYMALPSGTHTAKDYGQDCGRGRTDEGWPSGPCDEARAIGICVNDTMHSSDLQRCYGLFWCVADCGDACDLCTDALKYFDEHPTEWSPKIQAIGQDCGTACTWEQADEACAAAL